MFSPHKSFLWRTVADTVRSFQAGRTLSEGYTSLRPASQLLKRLLASFFPDIK